MYRQQISLMLLNAPQRAPKYSEEHLRYVERWYATKDVDMIAFELGISALQVHNMATKLRLRKSQNIRKPGSAIQGWVSLYLSGRQKFHAFYASQDERDEILQSWEPWMSAADDSDYYTIEPL